jgi:hypothetical protein
MQDLNIKDLHNIGKNAGPVPLILFLRLLLKSEKNSKSNV